jgi:predicted kinase
MKFINNFKVYSKITEEVSKNDPIPEITRMGRGLGVILLGAPGSGKSTFAKNYIYPHNRNIKDFSTDDVSFRFTKDAKKFYPGSTEINLNYLSNYMETGQNFIYDTTGSNAENVFKIFKLAKDFDYKVIFIAMLVDLETSKKRNILRSEIGGHFVDEDYIEFVYKNQMKIFKDYHNQLNPDNFYLVFNNNEKYKFYRFSKEGKLLKRKVDKYVSIVKESIDIKNEVDKIVENMLEFIDDGEKILFESPSGSINYDDYLQKNSRYDSFKPILKTKNKIVSKFTISYLKKGGTSFDNMINIIERMKTPIGRLRDMGWFLHDFEIVNNPGSYEQEVKISNLRFTFTKPDIDLGTEELPDEDELRESFLDIGLSITKIKIYDLETVVDFESLSYDGELPDRKYLERDLNRICDLFGFNSYELSKRSVTFYH